MTVRIVTDSTSDIPLPQAEKLGITIVPLTVFFGGDAYLDGVELDNASFYKKLASSKDLPRTSQPSPAAFQVAYTRLIQEGADAILSIHLSSKLSGTYQSACTARDSLPQDEKNVPIEIIDTQSISGGMSHAIIAAAKEARNGANLETLKALVLDRLARTRLLAAVDTLEYLKRGGRIGAAGALLGNMLSVKPIISVRDGEVFLVERPRTRSKAYTRIAQLVGEMGPIDSLTLIESNEEVGQQLAEALKATYHGTMDKQKFGAVLGAHAGPGIVGVSVVTA